MPSPYERQLDFSVPLLCIFENGVLYEFESTFLIEHPWKVSEKDASLSQDYSPLVRPCGKAGLVDIGVKGEVQTSVIQETPGADFVGTLHQQVLQLGGGTNGRSKAWSHGWTGKLTITTYLLSNRRSF